MQSKAKQGHVSHPSTNSTPFHPNLSKHPPIPSHPILASSIVGTYARIFAADDLNDRSLNSQLQRIWVGAYNLLDLLAVLEDEEGGHGADTEFLGYVWDFVDVELGEVDVGEFVGEPICGPDVSMGFLDVWGLARRKKREREINVLDDLRSDDLAGTAPGSETVKNNDLVLLEGGGIFILAVRERLLAYLLCSARNNKSISLSAGDGVVDSRTRGASRSRSKIGIEGTVGARDGDLE
ncbi:hypothetical protein ONS95_014473 [Cadophora gregata]|uniref:uncharacterized protein n=1 Tax=Cadophora gregata TaxID=51156 RepID=UPI0026DC634A|nr:uncharacterized protein ONS95_014473 [Cadophora gregata]KAK0112738.1 hypothetical protein ONS95_014473 [Cadophora gregata]